MLIGTVPCRVLPENLGPFLINWKVILSKRSKTNRAGGLAISSEEFFEYFRLFFISLRCKFVQHKVKK